MKEYLTPATTGGPQIPFTWALCAGQPAIVISPDADPAFLAMAQAAAEAETVDGGQWVIRKDQTSDLWIVKVDHLPVNSASK